MKDIKPFLAITAIEDFWDTSYRIVFLGEWCKRYNRRAFWRDIDSETMPAYFEEKKGRETYLYLNTVIERLFPILCKQMNRTHETNYGARYWRIILGTWLGYYTHIMYDRYKSLEHFIKLYPDFTSICLDKQCFVIPKDTMHFVNHIKEDDYNHQVYSNILRWMGYDLPSRRLTIKMPDVSIYYVGKSSPFKKILRKIYELACEMVQNNHQVFMRNTYFSYPSIFRLMLKTRGGAWPCEYNYQDLPDFAADHEARAILGKFEFGDNDFEKMLGSFIPYDMPKNMIEGFDFLRKKVKDDFISDPKAIISAVAWHFDNLFQIWAAESSEAGTILLGMQHGGNYGMAENLLEEDIELGMVDKFYSWGWEGNNAHAEIIPMPAPKLIESKKKILGRDDGVLYVIASFPRYLLQFPWSTDYWENYFSNQQLFLSRLSMTVSSQLRIRPYREDYGWDIEDRIRNSFPQIKIENWGISFSDSLSRCSLYVSDHPLISTTFIEALRSNRPTIGFYNPDFAANAVRDKAADLFGQLKSNSIIFDDPVTAAEHLNFVYGSVERWWNEPRRQGAVKNFLYRFGRTSSSWLQDWALEISNVTKNDVARAQIQIGVGL